MHELYRVSRRPYLIAARPPDLAFNFLRTDYGRLLPARQACYKCNMRRWMRDRGKRRKTQDDKPGQENPAPLQPKFPEPMAAEADADRQPDFAAQPETQAEPHIT